MASPTTNIPLPTNVKMSWAPARLGVDARRIWYITVIIEPHQKKAAEVIMGMNRDFSILIRASIWRVLKLSMVRMVATNMNIKSKTEVGPNGFTFSKGYSGEAFKIYEESLVISSSYYKKNQGIIFVFFNMQMLIVAN